MYYSKIELGTVEFVFDADIKYKTHRRSVNRFFTKVTTKFDARPHKAIEIDGTVFGVETVFLDPAGIEPGSIRFILKVFALCGTMGTIVTGVANYSKAKEQVPVILNDIAEIAKTLTDNAPLDGPPSRVIYPLKVFTRPKSTVEVLAELEAHFKTHGRVDTASAKLSMPRKPIIRGG